MTEDKSEGWDAVAREFMVVRSDSGASLVRSWAEAHIPPKGAILDVGCGSGAPIAQELALEGFEIFGIDPSPVMIAEFRRRLPAAQTACEAVLDSPFFNRSFDGVIAIGVIFLLSKEDQAKMITRLAQALLPGGRVLFSAPYETGEWKDTLTGRVSRSLGYDAYGRLLDKAGLTLVGRQADEGGSNYYDAIKSTA